MKPLRKAVFPVAGLVPVFFLLQSRYHWRCSPLSIALLIQYAVDEAVEAGIEVELCGELPLRFGMVQRSHGDGFGVVRRVSRTVRLDEICGDVAHRPDAFASLPSALYVPRGRRWR